MPHTTRAQFLLATVAAVVVVALPVTAGSRGEEVLESSSLSRPGNGPVCPEHGAMSSVLLREAVSWGSTRKM